MADIEATSINTTSPTVTLSPQEKLQQEITDYLSKKQVNEFLKKILLKTCLDRPENIPLYMVNYLKQEYNLSLDQPSSVGKNSKLENVQILQNSLAVNEKKNLGDSNEGWVVVLKEEFIQKRLIDILKRNILITPLEEEDRKNFINAMSEVTKKQGETIIKEGEENVYFYVLNEGECEIYATRDGLVKLGTLLPGSTFGELSILYQAPSPTTITAKVDTKLWALDKTTYHHIILNRRKLYEKLLEKVSILESIKSSEREQIAAGLQLQYFKPGDTIIKQYELGIAFYIIIEGQVEVHQDGKEIKQLGVGDYFGEIALLTQQPQMVIIIAHSLVKCGVLDRVRFKRILGPCEDILRRNLNI